MRVYYRSKRVVDTEMWGTPTTLHGVGGNWVYSTIVSPRTGKKFGYRIEDDCGTLIVTGPTFLWPIIAKASKGELPPLVTLAMQAQNALNERYVHA